MMNKAERCVSQIADLLECVGIRGEIYIPNKSQMGSGASATLFSVEVWSKNSLVKRLLIKVYRHDLPDWMSSWAKREIKFYSIISTVFQRQSEILPLPAYYGGMLRSSLGRPCIVLQDLTSTHSPSSGLLARNIYVESLARSLALWHSFAWENRRLFKALCPEIAEKPTLTSRILRMCTNLERFLKYFGNTLSAPQYAVYRRIYTLICLQQRLDWLCKRQERKKTLKNVTIVHGDLRQGNMLFPRYDPTEKTVLIDWQLWEVGVPTDDLAFFISLSLPPSLRSKFERQLLKSYFDNLLKIGVVDYPWALFVKDYKVSLLLASVAPIGTLVRNIASSHENVAHFLSEDIKRKIQNAVGSIVDWKILEDIAAAYR